MDFIAQHALQLNERNQKIGEIIAAVNDLADQSNILAVNASIEASKAGEEGKGFVVLAQEIRKLAEQSKQSTREIRVILEEIQKATSAAVLATDEGSKAVAKGEEQARLVREAILRLAAGVAGSAQSAVVIANSAKEQLIGMDQTSGAMDSIRMAGEQDRKIAARLKETANTLGDLSRQLVETSRSFRV
jgi:methyl-accepting chemotaxis protein